MSPHAAEPANRQSASHPAMMLQGAEPPKAPSGISKIFAAAQRMSILSIVLIAFLAVLQATMPPGHTPADMIGSFHGITDSAHQNASRESQALSAAAMAEAQAQAAARWQMEVEVMRQQQVAILQSVQMLTISAEISDGVCKSAPVVGWLLGRDAANYVRDAQAACGEAQRTRREIVAAQAEPARLGSAIMQRQPPHPPVTTASR